MFFVNSIPVYQNTNEYVQIPQTNLRALPLAQQQHPSQVPFTQSHILTFTAPDTHEFIGKYRQKSSDHHAHSNDLENARDEVINLFTTLHQQHDGASELLTREINDSVLRDIFFEKQLGNWPCCGNETGAIVVKGFVLIFVFAMYVACLILIMEFTRSITSCEGKIIRKEDGNVSYKCDDLGQYCKFNWLGQNLTVKSYLTARMISYILSSFPFIFMIYAKQRHLKNWINRVMGRENEKLQKYEDSRSHYPSVKLIKTIGATLDKDALKSISKGLFIVIYNIMGILIFILDIDLALFLNDFNEGNINAAQCRNIINSGKGKTDFINYVDEKGETMNIHKLCILLTTLNSIYFAWSVVYTTIGFCSNERDRHITNVLRREDAKQERENRRNEGGPSGDGPH